MSGSGADAALAALVDVVLAPVLPDGVFTGPAPAGRAGGAEPDPVAAWPEPDGPVRLVWTAEPARVASTLPGLWAHVGPRVPAERGADLVVDLDAVGRLVAADLGTVPVAELLAALGDRDGAAAAEQAVGQRAEVAVPALADLLVRLWAAGA